MVGYEVTLVPFLERFFTYPAKGALDLALSYECYCRQNISIEGQDLNNEPSVDACKLELLHRVHLKELRVKDRSLVLENRDGVEYLFNHMVLVGIGDQRKPSENRCENMSQV